MKIVQKPGETMRP